MCSFSAPCCTIGQTKTSTSKPCHAVVVGTTITRDRILTHLRRAAGPHTKLLVVDNLLPYACIDEDSETSGGDSEGAVRSLVPDGSPLLPNLGRASANGYLLDISVTHHPSLSNDILIRDSCFSRCSG